MTNHLFVGSAVTRRRIDSPLPAHTRSLRRSLAPSTPLNEKHSLESFNNVKCIDCAVNKQNKLQSTTRKISSRVKLRNEIKIVQTVSLYGMWKR